MENLATIANNEVKSLELVKGNEDKRIDINMETRILNMLDEIYNVLMSSIDTDKPVVMSITPIFLKYKLVTSVSKVMQEGGLIQRCGVAKNASYKWTSPIRPNIYMARQVTLLYRKLRSNEKKISPEKKAIVTQNVSSEILQILIDQKMKEVRDIMDRNDLSSQLKFEQCQGLMNKIEEYKSHIK